jgi:hypothetical protein
MPDHKDITHFQKMSSLDYVDKIKRELGLNPLAIDDKGQPFPTLEQGTYERKQVNQFELAHISQCLQDLEPLHYFQPLFYELSVRKRRNRGGLRSVILPLELLYSIFLIIDQGVSETQHLSCDDQCT